MSPIENSKFEIGNSNKPLRSSSVFELRFSSLFRVSNFGLRILAVTLIFLNVNVQHAASQVSNLKRDQDVVFFPTLACRTGSNCWDLDIHGCVYEPDKRTVALAVIRAALGLEHVSLTPPENKVFAERARLFMVDHKADKKIVVRIGDAQFTLPKTGANGDFSAVIHLSDSQV